MGKKRGGKKKGKGNFKVVGDKSLKAKNKTKAVKVDLKKISKAANKQKLKEVDEQLVKLQDKIVQKPQEKKSKPIGKKGKNARGKKIAKAKLAETTSETVDKLEKMEVAV